jgi:hypothetical protein
MGTIQAEPDLGHVDGYSDIWPIRGNAALRMMQRGTPD